jgi:hypothetical protein
MKKGGFMKKILFSAFMFSFTVLSACSSGNLDLVNTQEIKLDNIVDIGIIYSSENISIFMGTADTLIIKEYMSEDNNQYYAKISNTGNTVTIENGNRPLMPVFNFFNRRLEVYLPISYKNAVSIKTSSGNIETSGIICSDITIKSSSGSISANFINAEKINLETSSGRINCTVNENAADITINSSSGSVRLYLPQSLSFGFSSRTTSGRLTTPFTDRLSSPVNDRNLVQGIIGNNNDSGNISKVDIRTNSGSISVEWK